MPCVMNQNGGARFVSHGDGAKLGAQARVHMVQRAWRASCVHHCSCSCAVPAALPGSGPLRCLPRCQFAPVPATPAGTKSVVGAVLQSDRGPVALSPLWHIQSEQCCLTRLTWSFNGGIRA